MTIYRLGELTPELPPAGSYWVAPSAVVVGQVRLGREVSIWFGASLRADNDRIEIGEGSNIQEKATLHVDPGFPLSLGPGCTIGHNAILHGCTIGAGSLVGMGASILNGARIGANCLVGANALVTEGKAFEDGMLIVGAPARALRPLREQELEAMRRAAADYAARWRHYAEALVEIPG